MATRPLNAKWQQKNYLYAYSGYLPIFQIRNRQPVYVIMRYGRGDYFDYSKTHQPLALPLYRRHTSLLLSCFIQDTPTSCSLTLYKTHQPLALSLYTRHTNLLLSRFIQDTATSCSLTFYMTN